jgi:hypothetical protein
VTTAHDAAGSVNKSKNAHYTATGFFDIHVCDWPNQPPFYLTLYSTTKFNDVESVEVFNPDGTALGSLDLSRYRLLKEKNKPLKHVFITHIPVPPGATDGWFSAKITLKDGTRYLAKDKVVHAILPRAISLMPKDHETLATVPTILSWDKVPGARFYRVFIRDAWNDDKLIYKSRLIRTPHMRLPQGLLKLGGLYSWRVHARDRDESVEMGDFNAGSLTAWSEFSILEK